MTLCDPSLQLALQLCVSDAYGKIAVMDVNSTVVEHQLKAPVKSNVNRNKIASGGTFKFLKLHLLFRIF